MKKSNLFCNLEDLTNEASVEQFFVSRLLRYLGYKDAQIKPKTAIEKLSYKVGSRTVKHKPDYALVVKRFPRCIIEVKAPGENLDKHIDQAAGYCLALNRRASNRQKPVEHFILTNGITTRLYAWDAEDPLIELGFSDFSKANPSLKELAKLLAPSQLGARKYGHAENSSTLHELHRFPIGELNAAFAWCHQFIYKKDNLSQSAAFMEFVKIIFLKLLSDKDIHRRHAFPAHLTQLLVPATEVRFSSRWIESMEKEHPNPLDAVQFQQLLSELEIQITRGTKKRIFDTRDHIRLTPETIKGVVERLEHIDLYAVDADLNGRLFETFLNATMRGKDLGQFFTPRSVVKLAMQLADVEAHPKHPEIVIDACCGTGGFLIDALGWMWAKIDANRALSEPQRRKLKKHIANKCIYGIDIASDPPLARIARMNMYLHGDGGSSIFHADALDKKLRAGKTESPESHREKRQLRSLLKNHNGFADVVITNPPFAKEYQTKFPREKEILSDYDLAHESEAGLRHSVVNLKSSLMFLERYHDILKPGGRLVTVIDDSLLGGAKYSDFRNFLRDRYLIRAVVSLPGDAFQRSNARVKTSLLCLEKKTRSETQGGVFMYYCSAIGLDDPPRQRVLPRDAAIRKQALNEVQKVGRLYREFIAGQRSAAAWTVPVERIADRIDVKSCLPKPGKGVAAWKRKGLRVAKLEELVDVLFPYDGDEEEQTDLIRTDGLESNLAYLRVRYDGVAELGEEVSADTTNYDVLWRVHEGDIVISHINAVNGAIAVVPPELDGAVVTHEFTVCRAKPGYDPRFIWLLLRSPIARADLLLLATGIGRTRITWDYASSLQVPIPSRSNIDKVTAALRKAEAEEKRALLLRSATRTGFESKLMLDSVEAQEILIAFKPPK